MRRIAVKTVGATLALGLIGSYTHSYEQDPERVAITAAPEVSVVQSSQLEETTLTTAQARKAARETIKQTAKTTTPTTSTIPQEQESPAVSAEEIANGVYVQDVVIPALTSAGIESAASSKLAADDRPNEFMVSLDGHKAVKFIISEATTELQVCLATTVGPTEKNLQVTAFGNLDDLEGKASKEKRPKFKHVEGPDQCGVFFDTSQPEALVELVVEKAKEVVELPDGISSPLPSQCFIGCRPGLL